MVALQSMREDEILYLIQNHNMSVKGINSFTKQNPLHLLSYRNYSHIFEKGKNLGKDF